MSGFRFLAGLVSCLAVLSYVEAVSLDITSVNEDDGTVTFTATPDSVTTTPWFLNFQTADGSALDTIHFTSTSGVLSNTGNTFDVEILDNPAYEGDLQFDIEFTGGANLGDTFPQLIAVTIVDDEDPPVELVQPFNMTVFENVGEVNVTLSRLSSTTRTFVVDVHTLGTAEETLDFNLVTPSPIAFPDSENDAVLTIMIEDDSLAEVTEWICVFINSTETDEEFTFYINIIDNDTPKSFHCLRGSQDCKNGGTCNSDDFNCDCPMGFQGADCGIADGAVTSDCASCINGTCVSGECICDPGFSGEACDLTAYYHDCTATSFGICFSPFGFADFQGDMFVEGFGGEPDCVLTPAPSPSDPDDGIPDFCMGFAAVIDFNGTCGELGPVPDANLTEYEVVIKVHYTPNISKSSDETVVLTCTQGDSVLVSGSRRVTGIDQTYPQVGESDFAPAVLTLTDTNGAPLQDPLQGATIVKGCVSVSEVPAYEIITIDKIIADNGRTGSDFRSVVLYDEGCFPTPGIIFNGPAREPTGETHTMCFTFEAFIFSHDALLPEPLLILTVEFHVGAAGDAVVDHVCSARRKRETGVIEQEGQLEAKIAIKNMDIPKRETGSLIGSEEASCARWLYPAFIGVGVVAIAMMVIIIVLAVAVFRGFNERRRPKEIYN